MIFDLKSLFFAFIPKLWVLSKNLKLQSHREFNLHCWTPQTLPLIYLCPIWPCYPTTVEFLRFQTIKESLYF